MKKSLWILPLFTAILFSTTLNAQFGCVFNTNTNQWEAPDGGPCVNTIITAVPFLRLAVDARSGGMGEAGLAISPDANAMHYNESKLAFADQKSSIAANFSPWNNNVGFNLFYLTGYHKLSDKNAIGGGFRYFSLGQAEWVDSTGQTQNFRPKEIELEVSYSTQLSKSFALGIGLKYIFSDLAGGQTIGDIEITPGKSIAVDLSMTYFNDKIKFFGKPTDFRLGTALSNLGRKITYTNSINRDFIPTNLGLGTAWKINFAEHQSITLAFDVNKLLVPTPSQIDENGDGSHDYRTKTTIEGILDSFNDAPGGGTEELRELQYALGLEYWLQQKWALRAGYFSEHETKGNKKYYTVGIGSRFKRLGLDLSAEIPKPDKQSTFDRFGRTFRFTMMYDFGSKEEPKM